MGQERNSENDLIENINTICFQAKKQKKHECTYPGCKAIFYRPSRLARHVRLHTGEKSHKCNYPNCDKAYTNSSHLKRHMETHNTTKTIFQCTECSLFIVHRHNLKRHYRTQHDRGKLTCKICNESFTKKYQLATHMATHGSVSYICEKCGKSFISNPKLKRHRKIHEKRYPCTVPGCNEVLEKWLLLRAHLKTQHVKTHKCTDCDKVFLFKSHLKMHSQVHMKHRLVLSCPYDKCPRVYCFQKNLDQHIRVHHLEHKYECDICKLKISSKAKLKNHIQNLHVLVKRIKRTRKSQRKRKDVGLPKRSMVSKLTGVILPPQVEKIILERENVRSSETYETVLNTDSDL